MKKQLSYTLRLLLLSGVAVIMGTSCIFIPPKENKEVINSEVETADDGSTILKKDGLTCVWQDEFDYTGVPNPEKWRYQTGAGGWGNAEVQTYVSNTETPDTAIVENGVLTIKAYKDGNTWKSARLNSKQNWKYGLIEARMKVTNRNGAWPAFWMMPQNSEYGEWPASGEIDIMENAPSTCGSNRVFSTLHAAGHYAGDGQSIGAAVYDEHLSSEWHTLGVTIGLHHPKRQGLEDCVQGRYQQGQPHRQPTRYGEGAGRGS